MEGNRRREAARALEEQRIHRTEEPDRKPGERRVIDGEEGGATEDGAPAAPFAVEGAIEETAEQEFLGKGRHQDADEHIRKPEAWALRHQLLRAMERLSDGRPEGEQADI